MDDKLLKKNDISYIPKIEYEKNYDTDGRTEKYDYETDNVKRPSIIETLNNGIQEFYKVFPLIPDDLKEVAKKPIDVIGEIIGEIPDGDDEDYPSKENVIIVQPEITPPSEEIYPEDPFAEESETIKVIIDELKVSIRQQYYHDISAIFDDYIKKLNDISNAYTTNILASFRGNETPIFSKIISPYNIATSNISLNYKHLSDGIIRSQISRVMKQRLYSKLYDIDKTINHIRACKAGVEQRIRYHEESYGSSNSFNDSVSNKILGQSRVIYDNKYKQNFLNLYKYLNSSVILLNECFNMCLNEAQSKTILIERKEAKELW